MRPRGHRHWTERVTVLNYSPGGPDPNNPMGDPLPPSSVPDPARSNVRAAVQSLDREAIIQAGLNTSEEHWWIRIGPGPRLTQQGNRIRWHSSDGDVDLVVVSVNAIPGEDAELTVTRAPHQ